MKLKFHLNENKYIKIIYNFYLVLEFIVLKKLYILKSIECTLGNIRFKKFWNSYSKKKRFKNLNL